MSHTLRSIELYLVRLPLVRPFTTWSHTKDHLDHILIHVVVDHDGGRAGANAPSAAEPLLLLRKIARRRGTSCATFWRPGLLGVD